MKAIIEVKSVEQKKYRKGPNVDQPYSTVAGLDTEKDPWLKQIIEVRCDPPRTDLNEGDICEIGISSISMFNGIVQLDGDLRLAQSDKPAKK